MQLALIEVRELRLRQVAHHLSQGNSVEIGREEMRRGPAQSGATQRVQDTRGEEEREEEWEWPEWWPLKKLNKTEVAERAEREEEELRRRLARLREG